MTSTSTAGQAAGGRTQRLSLAAALLLMVAGTAYPRLFADATGRADHAFAMAIFWAMSAGFVHGVGFVPRARAIRWLLSGWACLGALIMAGAIKLAH